MSYPKQQDLDSIDQTPPWPGEPSNDLDPISADREPDKQGLSAERKPNKTVAHLRPSEGRDLQARKQPDIFAEALAKVTQEQLEPELLEAPSFLLNRHSFGIAAGFVVCVGVAALAALAFIVAFPASQDPAEEDASSAQHTWQLLKSPLLPGPQRRTAPTLAVRDSSGPVNEPVSLGVSVNSPGAGATVTIERMPASARLTVGKRMSTTEWRVPAQEISDASIIPPADFVGVMNLTAELRGSDGAALVSSVVRPTWTSATRPGGTVGVSASAATAASGPAATTPLQQQQPLASPGPPGAARAELPVREINPDEVAGFVRRAQELLANGDLQAARLLLLRAAEARDARAALLLAKTFDPIVSKQFGVAEAEPDLAQARNWYQKAEKWGASEARHELDALASYTR